MGRARHARLRPTHRCLPPLEGIRRAAQAHRRHRRVRSRRGDGERPARRIRRPDLDVTHLERARRDSPDRRPDTAHDHDGRQPVGARARCPSPRCVLRPSHERRHVRDSLGGATVSGPGPRPRVVRRQPVGSLGRGRRDNDAVQRRNAARRHRNRRGHRHSDRRCGVRRGIAARDRPRRGDRVAERAEPSRRNRLGAVGRRRDDAGHERPPRLSTCGR